MSPRSSSPMGRSRGRSNSPPSPFSALIDRYKKAVCRGAVEDSTLCTIRVHARHLKRILGEKLDVKALTETNSKSTSTRRAEKNKQKTAISPITIRKELTTLSGVWTWAMASGVVATFPNKGLKYPKGTEKPSFQTWEEIDKQIERGKPRKVPTSR